jgi:energy-coupling factor transporter transmembrane protein EcfT
MNRNQDFSHLNFRSRISRLNPRLVIFMVSLVGYLFLMWVLPSGLLLTILLFIVPTLVWVASYGWRTALNQVIRYLQRFQIN